MTLPKFDGPTFRRSVLGAGASAALVVMAATSVHADSASRDVTPVSYVGNEICLPLKEINGRILSSNASADLQSDQNPGELAISTMPGPDIRTTPASLTNLFKGDGYDASCFINNSYFENNGTLFRFYLAGVPVEYNGQVDFGIQELRENPDILSAIRSEVALVRGGTVAANNVSLNETDAVRTTASLRNVDYD